MIARSPITSTASVLAASGLPFGGYANGFTNANTANDIGVGEASGDARYTFPTSFPLSLKSGFKLRDQTADDASAARRCRHA